MLLWGIKEARQRTVCRTCSDWTIRGQSPPDAPRHPLDSCYADHGFTRCRSLTYKYNILYASQIPFLLLIHPLYRALLKRSTLHRVIILGVLILFKFTGESLNF